VPPIVHAVGSLFVVAFGNLADPVGPIADDGGKFGRGAALGQQPQDLPPGALVRLFGCSVVVFKFVDARDYRRSHKVLKKSHAGVASSLSPHSLFVLYYA
jgi:hypothetical protein